MTAIEQQKRRAVNNPGYIHASFKQRKLTLPLGEGTSKNGTFSTVHEEDEVDYGTDGSSTFHSSMQMMEGMDHGMMNLLQQSNAVTASQPPRRGAGANPYSISDLAKLRRAQSMPAAVQNMNYAMGSAELQIDMAGSISKFSNAEFTLPGSNNNHNNNNVEVFSDHELAGMTFSGDRRLHVTPMSSYG
jgi:hypothetical protein